MTATSEALSRDVPTVNLDRIEGTYAELKKMEIVLDPNPIEYGPRRFSNRIAQVRAMLNRVEQIFLQTSEDLHYFQRVINARRMLYEFEKRDLMINDPKCRLGPTRQEREALADGQLREQLEEIQKLEMEAHDLETLMLSIKAKRTDLKDVQGRMRDQMKLIEHDLGMGARWGSNAPPTSASASLKEIDELLVTVDRGLGVAEEEEAEDAEGVEEEQEDDAGEEGQEETLEPVMTFGEETEDGDAESLIPDEGAEGDLPEDDHAQDEADDFLEAFSMGTSDEQEKAPTTTEEEDDSSIDNLIASLIDD